MKKLYLLALLIANSFSASAQGYLGKNAYVSADIIHPFLGPLDIRLNGGILFKRFYALDLQFNHISRNIDVYSNYRYIFAGQGMSNEYYAGKLRMSGNGVRLAFRSFTRPGYKAAPIGWYINYAIDYMQLSFKGDITTEKPQGTTYNDFSVNRQITPMDARMTLYSFLISPGKTIRLSTFVYLDIGIDLGLRLYKDKANVWTGTEDRYTYEALFTNKINTLYQNKNHGGNLNAFIPETIYEPVIKIGYIF